MANIEKNAIIDLTSDTDDVSPTTSSLKRSGDAAVVSATKKKKRKTAPTLSSIYIVCTCNYPCQNDKWGEHSGHETEDTNIIGVYASLKDANRRARQERDIYEDSDEEEEEEDDDDSLFYWQDDEPAEWTARRVWVEEQNIQY